MSHKLSADSKDIEVNIFYIVCLIIKAKLLNFESNLFIEPSCVESCD